MNGKNIGSWDQWAIHLVKTLEDQGEDISRIFETLSEIKQAQAVQRAKATIFGAVAGLVMTGVVNLIVFLIVNKGG